MHKTPSTRFLIGGGEGCQLLVIEWLLVIVRMY